MPVDTVMNSPFGIIGALDSEFTFAEGEFDLQTWLDDSLVVFQEIDGLLKGVIASDFQTIDMEEPISTKQAVEQFATAVDGMTDPVSTNPSSINEFRTLVSNATTPAYSGDAMNDDLFKLIAFVTESKPTLN